MSPNAAQPRLEQPAIGIGVVVFKGKDVLLIRRGKEPNKGALSLPGGAQELGETIRDAARREVIEETGIEAEIGDVIDVIDAIHQSKEGTIRFHYTIIDLAAVWRSGTPTAGSDAADAFWHPVDQIEDLNLWSETTRVIKLALSARPNAEKSAV